MNVVQSKGRACLLGLLAGVIVLAPGSATAQPGCVEPNSNTETLVQRLLSDNMADKVIVTTIQKLGLALDGDNKRKYKERLQPLRDKRMAIIFDECHRSQFGDTHQTIKEFFPNAQLFGFTVHRPPSRTPANPPTRSSTATSARCQ